MSLELTSPAFDSGETIPTEYTCDGDNVSPPLKLRGVPQETDSIVLICDDPDASPDPHGPFTHWILYNLPAGLKEIPEGFKPKGKRAKGRAGINSFGEYSYVGPCPPGGKTHRYVFRAYALKGDLDLPPEANREQVLQGIKDHILDQAVHLGEYSGEITYADRGGHIPDAVNIPWLDVLTGGDAILTTQEGWQAELQDKDVELFRSATDIQRLLDTHGIRRDQEVITYCQTLWRGVHTYFLLRLMGYDNVRSHDGSWSEWGNNPDLPVVTGSQPGSLDLAE